MKSVCYILDDSIFQQIRIVLELFGFSCERFTSDMSALCALRRYDYDLVVVEMGADLSCRDRIFSWLSCATCDSAPIVLLSSIHNAQRTAAAFDAGADDIMYLPLEPIEFAARLTALLRRSNRQHSHHLIELAGFSLDHEAGVFLDHGDSVELTRREFSMAWLFFSMPDIYISREKISNSIWGTSSDIANRTIEQHVYKLRKKLRLSAERGVIIRTAYTQGYRLELARHTAAPNAAVQRGVFQTLASQDEAACKSYSNFNRADPSAFSAIRITEMRDTGLAQDK